MSERLTYLTQQLQQMAAIPTDVEAVHARADALLLEALRELARIHTREEIGPLVAAYESVPKWYA